MEIIDNINKTVKEDLELTISKGDKLAIASAYFSIYAYEALRKQLDSIDEMRFIFTAPTFLNEKIPREKREYLYENNSSKMVKDGTFTTVLKQQCGKRRLEVINKILNIEEDY